MGMVHFSLASNKDRCISAATLNVFKVERPLIPNHFYFSFFSLSAILIAIVIVSRFEVKRAKAFNSLRLRAEASHCYSDIGPIALVLIALSGSRVGSPILDRLDLFGAYSLCRDVLQSSCSRNLDDYLMGRKGKENIGLF